MTEEETTIVIYEENFPTFRNETVETTVATAILQGFGETAKAIQLNEHVEDDQEEKHDSKKKIKYKYKCLFFEACSKTFENLEETIGHMIAEHEVEKDHILLQEFNSLDDFQIWKDHLELDNYVYYIRRNKQDKRFVYYCCRDGQPKQDVQTEGDLKKETKTKMRKTKQLAFTCPSKMIARMLDTGKVELIFYRIHSHVVTLEDTQHHPVPQLLKQELYAQFALNASVEDVHAMLHRKETSVYPIYKAVVRDLNIRRIRKIAKDFHADIGKHSVAWDRIRPSAHIGRTEGPVASEENKRLKLISVQQKLEQLYHLLDEPVTQNLLLNYMDSSLTTLLNDCSAAFVVSDIKFPVEDECIVKYEKQVVEGLDETIDTSNLANSEHSEDQARELVAQEENLMDQGVKRKFEESDDLKQIHKRNNLDDLENNQPVIDPVTGNPIGIKFKQNRKKLFKVPQRPRFPGLPIKTLDAILRQPDEANSCDDVEKSKKTPDGSSKRSVSDKGGSSSSNMSSKTLDAKQANKSIPGIKENRSMSEMHVAVGGHTSHNVTSDGSTSGADITATEVLLQLQSDAIKVQDVQMIVGKRNETSVSSQLLEIVNLARSMVEGDSSSEQVIILNEHSGLFSNVEVTDEKL